MMHSTKAAVLLVALITATFIIAVAANAQAEQQQQQLQQNKTVSNNTDPNKGATGAVGSGGEARSGVGVAPSVIYPRQQTAKTIQFRSMVQDVEVTGFVITADDQVKVSLTHQGAQKSPAVTVIVSTEWISMPPYMGVAVPTPSRTEPSAGGVAGGGEANTKPGYYPYPNPYPSLVGSNVVKGDWGSAAEIKLGLVGNGTIYDATSIQVLIIPYTGSS
ncbi:MAG: hypothetical protein M1503_07855 [Thaumarchaeota archaeon]|nr:hypothetical protein [Nitrososphaerota archaeon]MCL5318157.1 hypothetical protein [Nitrososphaerota archaeon]